MSGIYIHIPFCKQKCYYCDFYSNTNVELAQAVTDAEIREINIRKEYLKDKNIGSVYFGGGTPSMLTIQQVDSLLQSIHDNFRVISDCEITVECNPDDLTIEYLKSLKTLGINRISIGIQSFNDDILRFLNRRHDSNQAQNSIKLAREAEFQNISIDLMFGIPGLSEDNYKVTLNKAMDFNVDHISAYQLTIEPRTVLHKKLINGAFEAVSEDEILRQFDYTIETLKENGFQQYEVSNYAKDGKESKHNWLYWSNGNYLGIGPSAHSYDGETRQWNISNHRKYIGGVNEGAGFFEIESLNEIDKYNEYILTSLRTKRGISESFVRNNFNKKISAHFEKVVEMFVNKEYMKITNEKGWALEKKGLFILDFIIEKFYYN